MKYSIYYIFTAIIIYLYTIVSKGYYSEFSLLENSPAEFLILTLLFLISAITLKKKVYLVSLIILPIYITLDIASLVYNRDLDYTYLANIPLLVDAIIQSKGFIVYIIFTFILSIILFLIYKYEIIKKIFLSYFLVIVISIILTIPQLYISSYFLDFFQKNAPYKKEFWSEEKLYFDYKKAGRLSSFLHSGLIKEQNRLNADKLKINQPKQLKIIVSKLKNKIQKRDVYIVGLESFFLPKKLKNLKLNKEIPTIKNSSQHRSSIFGGATIQSEFEVLCGTPALQKFSAFELTEFKGVSTNCLPTILKELGYSTIFTNAFKPQPSIQAAKGLGFDDINFPKEYLPTTDTYLTNKNISKGEYAIYDDDLYKQNSQYIQENYKNKPILNYIFSVWGHAFHEMTDASRPQIIKIINKDKLNISDHTQRAINQQYYRIVSIKKYLEYIKKISPNALVVLYSDHLPVLDNKDSYETYGLDGGLFDNFLLVMDKGKIIKYDKVNLYAVMDIILDRLTNGWYCKNNSCKIKETYSDRYSHLDDYYNIMIPAMKQPSQEDLPFLQLDKKYNFNSTDIKFNGFSTPEASFRWSEGFKSTISFKTNNTNIKNISLDIGTFGKQDVTIYLNNNIILKNKTLTNNTVLNLKVKKSFFNLEKVNTLTFKMPDARQPGTQDSRVLAIQYKSIKLCTAH